MNFKYRLPDPLIKKTSGFEEFANGAAQVTFKLRDGRTYAQGLISNSTWIIALRGHKDLPFVPSDIEEIYQTEDDRHPKERGGWDYWDNWA